MSIMESWVEVGSTASNLWAGLSEWSQATFGSDRERGPVAPLKHLACEVQEAIDSPHDIKEYADCLMLVFDSSRRAGFSLRQLLEAAEQKLDENRRRNWPTPSSSTEPVFHTKGGDVMEPINDDEMRALRGMFSRSGPYLRVDGDTIGGLLARISVYESRVAELQREVERLHEEAAGEDA